jgi:hypothetical protein
LRADPLSWLLEEDSPAVRHMVLRLLLDQEEDEPEVRAARRAAMRADPIAAILDRQQPGGYWVKPGPGYAPKYTGTVWSVIFLDQLGADGRDRRIRKASEYVLSHTQASTGGFASSGAKAEGPPSPSTVIHCLNGNLLRAMIGFGWLHDPRVQRAIDWQARSVTGEGFRAYSRSGTTGPRFACVANGGLPCAWGAIKALRGLARIPSRRRTAAVRRAVDVGLQLLLSRDPEVADYPATTRVSRSWHKLGFPSGYIADVLQNLETLTELGHARDPRLWNAVGWVLSQQDEHGRWWNRYAYNGKTWMDIERQGTPSKWVTLRACFVLKHALHSEGNPRSNWHDVGSLQTASTASSPALHIGDRGLGS